jgi:hypothetical protein
MGSYNTWVNNVAVADPRTDSRNRAINDVSTNGYVNKDVKWYNNITFNGTPREASVLSDGQMPDAANGNLLGLDPLLSNPATGDFHLKPGSPATNAGTSAFGLGSVDIDGQARVNGKVDIGADEATSSADTPPNAQDVSGSAPR